MIAAMGTELAVVLVRPARPANVGAVARALKNFGHRDLRLVGARDLLEDGAARAEAAALAWNAADVLEGAAHFDDLGQAIADLHLTAATTARLDAPGQVASPRELALEASRLPPGCRAGCVFGPEAHGLSNVELDRCRLRVRIPSCGEQPSLNLAQAVVILAYEFSRAPSGAGGPADGSGHAPASEEAVDRLAAAARDLGLRAGYLNPQAPEHVLGELRRLLARARPTEREITLLLGLVAQLDWARRHLGDT